LYSIRHRYGGVRDLSRQVAIAVGGGGRTDRLDVHLKPVHSAA
jgi:hypothetical protein